MNINPIGSYSYIYPSAGNSSIGQSVNAVSKVKPSECQTCKNRKYMDGSNDNGVSYKTPTHISPSSSFAAVSSHEQEHVSHAISEGSKEGNQLISTSVSLKTAVCPECGTPYIEGGTTRTTIAYNTSNPYEKARKSIDGSLLTGMNFDAVA